MPGPRVGVLHTCGPPACHWRPGGRGVLRPGHAPAQRPARKPRQVGAPLRGRGRPGPPRVFRLRPALPRVRRGSARGPGGRSENALLRRGGCFTILLSYCMTQDGHSKPPGRPCLRRAGGLIYWRSRPRSHLSMGILRSRSIPGGPRAADSSLFTSLPPVTP